MLGSGHPHWLLCILEELNELSSLLYVIPFVTRYVDNPRRDFCIPVINSLITIPVILDPVSMLLFSFGVY